MFVAHAPVGWLVGRAVADRLRWPAAVPLAVLGALAPDVDLLASWATGRHHHAFPTHWPVAWVAVGVAAGVTAALRPTRRLGAAGLVIAANALLHLVLDSVVGDVRWLAPATDRAFALSHVARRFEPWWVNFLLHPSFALELLLVAAAARRWVTAGGRATPTGGTRDPPP